MGLGKDHRVLLLFSSVREGKFPSLLLLSFAYDKKINKREINRKRNNF